MPADLDHDLALDLLIAPLGFRFLVSGAVICGGGDAGFAAEGGGLAATTVGSVQFTGDRPGGT